MKKGRGWRKESHRHRLAGMGIKTNQNKIKTNTEKSKTIHIDDFLDRFHGFGIYYRGIGEEELEQIMKKGTAIKQIPMSLIGNDWEVLEYGFEGQWESLDIESDEDIEEFLDGVVPKWATTTGVNVTTDYDNAIGYAESRNGKIAIFTDVGNDDVFNASEVHFQFKNPNDLKLLAICDPENSRCTIYDENIGGK